MAPVEVRRTVPTPLDAVWDALTDFAAYGRWIPLTSMRTDPGPARLGWAFGGFTGLGPVGFLDSMLVVKWEPPLDGEARPGGELRGFGDRLGDSRTMSVRRFPHVHALSAERTELCGPELPAALDQTIVDRPLVPVQLVHGPGHARRFWQLFHAERRVAGQAFRERVTGRDKAVESPLIQRIDARFK